MPSKPQQPRRLPSGFYSKLQFWNQWLPLIKMSYSLSYSENFHFSNFQHPASGVVNKFEKWMFLSKNLFNFLLKTPQPLLPYLAWTYLLQDNWFWFHLLEIRYIFSIFRQSRLLFQQKFLSEFLTGITMTSAYRSFFRNCWSLAFF